MAVADSPHLVAIAEHSSWRWVFFLNLPVGGLASLLLVLSLQDRKEPQSGDPSNDGNKAGMWKQLCGLDYVGNVIFVAAVTLVLFALVYGGSKSPWTSHQTLMFVVGGIVLLVVFLLYEGSKFCGKPIIPPRIFRNRTTATALMLTFLHSVTSTQILYFLPVYFQAVMVSTPTLSGFKTLPTVVLLIPSSFIGGILLSKFGTYRSFHIVGFGLMAIGLGCFTTLTRSTPVENWVVLQIIGAIGSGLVVTTLLPAVNACLSSADIASATATWAFMRSFGIIWGVAVPAAIFDARAQELALGGLIDDEDVAAILAEGGGAYEHATAAWISSLTFSTLRDSVITLYERSLRTMWIFATALAVLAFLLVFVEKEVILRDKPGMDEEVETVETEKVKS